jgi:hypothetical protein
VSRVATVRACSRVATAGGTGVSKHHPLHQIRVTTLRSTLIGLDILVDADTS